MPGFHLPVFQVLFTLVALAKHAQLSGLLCRGFQDSSRRTKELHLQRCGGNQASEGEKSPITLSSAPTFV